MNTFYSILYCPTRLNVDEKVSIAFFLKQGDKIFFNFSEDKLNVIKQLIPKDAFDSLKSNLLALEKHINAKNNNAILANTEDKIFESSYFDYLSRYSNNLLSFSKPEAIKIEVNKKVFNKLFEQYIFESTNKPKSLKATFDIEKYKKKYTPKLKVHANIEPKLTSDQIKTLHVPTKVWFIGKNGSYVTGETMDFNKTSINNELRSYLYLTNSIEDLNENTKSKFFLIGNEPDKSLVENHRTWEEIRKLKGISFIERSEFEAVEEYLKEKHVQPLSK